MRFLVDYLKSPEWRRQHGWRKAVWLTMSGLGLTGMHALPLNRRWMEIHRRPMPMRHLDPDLEGMRIVHISDLHFSPVVWQRYLLQPLNWINELQPDLVVVTGDLITGGYRYADKIATLLSHLRTTRGVVCSFGNHDYGLYGHNGSREARRRGDYLEECLEDHGVIVLRNESLTIRAKAGGSPLVLVGLDDEWSGQINPELAFKGLTGHSPVICLNHNPANVHELMDYPWQWMLSGHTHGRQVATTRIGRTLYPKRYRHYTHGYYHVGGRHLYVNRGLSYGQRTLHWCRPEITVFRLSGAS